MVFLRLLSLNGCRPKQQADFSETKSPLYFIYLGDWWIQETSLTSFFERKGKEPLTPIMK